MKGIRMFENLVDGRKPTYSSILVHGCFTGEQRLIQLAIGIENVTVTVRLFEAGTYLVRYIISLCSDCSIARPGSPLYDGDFRTEIRYTKIASSQVIRTTEIGKTTRHKNGTQVLIPMDGNNKVTLIQEIRTEKKLEELNGLIVCRVIHGQHNEPLEKVLPFKVNVL